MKRPGLLVHYVDSASRNEWPAIVFASKTEEKFDLTVFYGPGKVGAVYGAVFDPDLDKMANSWHFECEASG
jgi:hypothetical protein